MANLEEVNYEFYSKKLGSVHKTDMKILCADQKPLEKKLEHLQERQRHLKETRSRLLDRPQSAQELKWKKISMEKLDGGLKSKSHCNLFSENGSENSSIDCTKYSHIPIRLHRPSSPCHSDSEAIGVETREIRRRRKSYIIKSENAPGRNDIRKKSLSIKFSSSGLQSTSLPDISKDTQNEKKKLPKLKLTDPCNAECDFPSDQLKLTDISKAHSADDIRHCKHAQHVGIRKAVTRVRRPCRKLHLNFDALDISVPKNPSEKNISINTTAYNTLPIYFQNNQKAQGNQANRKRTKLQTLNSMHKWLGLRSEEDLRKLKGDSRDSFDLLIEKRNHKSTKEDKVNRLK